MKTLYSILLQRLGALKRFEPLSLFGVISLSLSLAILKYLGIAQNDIVAYIVAGIVIFLILITIGGTFCLRIITSKRLTKIYLTPILQECLSNFPIDIKVILSQLALWPFWNIECKLQFCSSKVKTLCHIISGPIQITNEYSLNSTLTFPHRGYWTLRSLQLNITDRLGLTRLTWFFPLENYIEVSAKDMVLGAVSLQALDPHSGDLHNLQHSRQGDLYDIKQYDPSDGLKKILWKVFAKSGQLVVRRPEPATIPQGTIALYLVAKPEEDFVAGAIQTYINFLCGREIKIIFGTDGLRNIITESAIKTTINQMAMHDEAGTGQGLPSFLDTLKQQSQSLEVIIFTGATNTSWINNISPRLNNTAFKYTAVLIKKPNQPSRIVDRNILEANFGWKIVECDTSDES